MTEYEILIQNQILTTVLVAIVIIGMLVLAKILKDMRKGTYRYRL
ncbi:hypothetical protein [Candidatus Methanodesulfokora washburnensis]|nr:hypothetical protein [Candidatus Methanodesulfokores washburnensis]